MRWLASALDGEARLAAGLLETDRVKAHGSDDLSDEALAKSEAFAKNVDLSKESAGKPAHSKAIADLT